MTSKEIEVAAARAEVYPAGYGYDYFAIKGQGLGAALEHPEKVDWSYG